MSTPNKSQPQISFDYSATKGTKFFTAAATASYLISGWTNKDDIFNIPSISSRVTNHIPYNKIQPTVSAASLRIPPITLPPFMPTTAQFWYLLLGTITDSDPDVISEKSTGLKDAIDIHVEYTGGTNERITDCVTSYLIDMEWTLESGKPLTIDKSVFESDGIESKEGSIEYYENNSSVKLTTTPTTLQSGKIFKGIHETKFDTGDQNLTVDARISNYHSTQKTNASKAYYDEGTKRRAIYPDTFEDGHTVNHYVLTTDGEQYKNLVDKEEIICTQKVFKADLSDYILFTTTGLRVTDVNVGSPISGAWGLTEIMCKYRELTATIDDGENYGAIYNK